MLTRIHQGASLSQVSIFTAQNACPLIGGGTTEKSRGLSFVGKELSSVVNQRGFRAAELQRSALVAGTPGVQRISASWFRTSCGLGWHNVHAMDFRPKEIVFHSHAAPSRMEACKGGKRIVV